MTLSLTQHHGTRPASADQKVCRHGLWLIEFLRPNRDDADIFLNRRYTGVPFRFTWMNLTMAKAKDAGQKSQREHAKQIAKILAKTYPDAVCALHHRNAFELIVATILSAQCTDERVNSVTPKLFAKYPTAADLAKSKQEDVENIIRSLGFFRAKATSLRGMAKQLVDLHNGEVPQDLDQLVALPGTGRKTANVVLGTAFGIAKGVVVDTHVKRITRLLGLTTASTPEQIERDLMDLLPSSEWVNFSHRLIHHGRRICIARRPKCTECPLLSLCPRTGLPPLETDQE